MAIQRWDPLRDLVDLQQRVNRLFDETLSKSAGSEGIDAVNASGWKPSTDLIEETDRYVLLADLPGVAASDVEVKIDGGMLYLRGERKRDQSVSRESYLRVERPHGRFVVKIALAPSVDAQQVKAVHKNGVIQVVLPKRKGEATRPVEVASGEAGTN